MNISQEFFNVPKSLISRHYTDSNVLPEYRSEFMRDRDRLMYATAFRRLAGKTQIYTVGSDDHRKNRLTHTLEVSQIARTIAAALGLNTDLAEAIALAHDFGHTPFGHAGEQMLHEIMIPNATVVKNSPFYRTNLKTLKDTFGRESPEKIDYLDYAFGFKHNLQSVRVTALLEDSYRGGSDENIGLNLTNYTLYGMMLHSNAFYKHGDKYPNFHHFFDEQMKANGAPAPAWSFEAYIVKWADDIAQWHHDLEDAIRDGALPLSRICDTIKESLGEKLSSDDEQVLDDIKKITKMDRKCLADLSHIVVNTLVNDIIETSKSNFNVLIVEIETKNIDNPETFFNEYEKLGFSLNKENVISFSEKIKSQNFKDVIRASIHHSRNVVRMNEKGCYIIRKLFEAYYAHPQQLPDGPILHILVDIELDNYETIDKAKKAAIGDARIAFENVLKNPNIYTKCILMRRICDHIASMTDKYAVEEYNNLYG